MESNIKNNLNINNLNNLKKDIQNLIDEAKKLGATEQDIYSWFKI